MPPPRFPKHSRLQGLGDGADLVDFEQQAVAGFLGHTLGDAFGVGDREVVAHHLNGGAGCKIGPRFPVILVKGVLDGHHCSAEEAVQTKISVRLFRSNSRVICTGLTLVVPCHGHVGAAETKY